MPTPLMSDLTTDGVRVGATAFFLPEQSNPGNSEFVFGYRIVIVNNGGEAVKLLNRRWTIIDADGHVEEVRGEGVVGQQPTIKPGQGFKYTSFCPLTTAWGTMEGEYQMQRGEGELFDVKIGRFYLTSDERIRAKATAVVDEPPKPLEHGV